MRSRRFKSTPHLAGGLERIVTQATQNARAAVSAGALIAIRQAREAASGDSERGRALTTGAQRGARARATVAAVAVSPARRCPATLGLQPFGKADSEGRPASEARCLVRPAGPACARNQLERHIARWLSQRIKYRPEVLGEFERERLLLDRRELRRMCQEADRSGPSFPSASATPRSPFDTTGCISCHCRPSRSVKMCFIRSGDTVVRSTVCGLIL
jgi:hypothetical protein